MDGMRYSQDDAAWPQRPWIWAIICACGALAVNRLIEFSGEVAIWRQLAVTFVTVVTLGFVLTAELRRINWAIGFALISGAVLAFVGWFTASYNQAGNLAEYPFLAGIFAFLIAAPLFQTARDEGAWRFPYTRLHSHAWTDGVIGAAALIFTGVALLLVSLIALLFGLIGIDLFNMLLRKGWSIAIIIGFAFGAALGLLRERDALVATLQKLVVVIFSVLAPVLAVALAGFLISLPFTGLKPLWDSNVATTPLLLLAAAGAVGLINAVIGDGKDEGSGNRLLRGSALLLSVTILPLAVIAAISMGARIAQYGFTPGRIWGLVAVVVACVYGAAYLYAAIRAARAKLPLDWDDHIRPANIRIALGICVAALFLALPIVDFGAISAKDQLARLKSGRTEEAKFDWRAMASNFGPEGRKALSVLAKTGSKSQRESAKTALSSPSRWSPVVVAEQLGDFERNIIYEAGSKKLDAQGQQIVLRDSYCKKICRLVWLSERRFAIIGHRYPAEVIETDIYIKSTKAEIDTLKARGQLDIYVAEPDQWRQERLVPKNAADQPAKQLTAQSKIEIRKVERRQFYVDGAPVGITFEP